MNNYELTFGFMASTITLVVCPECDSREAHCDTSTLLTSLPPQYRCVCHECKYVWDVYTDRLNDILVTKPNPDDSTFVTRTELMLRINELEERICKLENKDDQR